MFKYITNLIKQLKKNKQESIDLIPSNSQLNNIIHKIIQKNTFIFNNIYAEGYPFQRYYEGCKEIDKIEIAGQAYLQQIYQYNYINIQPLSGSIANNIIYNALLKKDDIILSLNIHAGGHLTHNTINIASKLYTFINYHTENNTSNISYQEIKKLAKKYKPKIIVTGYSVGTYDIDHKKIKEIANDINAIYFTDLSHIMGLVAAKIVNQPYPYADIVMSTTHKTMCGFKGAIIMCKDSVINKKINHTLFPKTQGGYNLAQIIINTLVFKYIASKSFKEQMQKIIENTNKLTQYLNQMGIPTITAKTSNHMNVIDLHEQNIDVRKLTKILAEINIITNFNTTIKDKSFKNPSGIRFGSTIITLRKIKDKQIKQIAQIIKNTINDTINNTIHKSKIQYKKQVIKITQTLENIIN